MLTEMLKWGITLLFPFFLFSIFFFFLQGMAAESETVLGIFFLYILGVSL